MNEHPRKTSLRKSSPPCKSKDPDFYASASDAQHREFSVSLYAINGLSGMEKFDIEIVRTVIYEDLRPDLPPLIYDKMLRKIESGKITKDLLSDFQVLYGYFFAGSSLGDYGSEEGEFFLIRKHDLTKETRFWCLYDLEEQKVLQRIGPNNPAAELLHLAIRDLSLS